MFCIFHKKCLCSGTEGRTRNHDFELPRTSLDFVVHDVRLPSVLQAFYPVLHGSEAAGLQDVLENKVDACSDYVAMSKKKQHYCSAFFYKHE